MTRIFDGRDLAAKKEAILKKKVARLREKKNLIPKLATILPGSDPASVLYVNLKKKAAERIGCEVEIFEVGERKQADYIVRLIKSLNQDPLIHGIMVQMPLPMRMGKGRDLIIDAIAPQKDVDGLREDGLFIHPTVMAVLEAAKKSKRKPPAKVCVVGASGMVGRPLVEELEKNGFAVTACNSKTKYLDRRTREAEILISCAGVPGLITGEMVKKGAAVIDVGSPKGDVLFEEVKKKAGFITPVPGGIGPLTVSFLLENLIQSAYNTPKHTFTRSS